MPRIQKASKKIANHLFCAVTPINDKKKKKNNCRRQSFRADLENVRNTGMLQIL